MSTVNTQPFGLLAEGTLSESTLMSVIGHFVLFVLYGAWNLLVMAADSFRPSRIRLEEEEEEPLYGQGEVQSCWLGTDALPVAYVERVVTVVEEKSQY